MTDERERALQRAAKKCRTELARVDAWHAKRKAAIDEKHDGRLTAEAEAYRLRIAEIGDKRLAELSFTRELAESKRAAILATLAPEVRAIVEGGEEDA